VTPQEGQSVRKKSKSQKYTVVEVRGNDSVCTYEHQKHSNVKFTFKNEDLEPVECPQK
jgi:hypothetical protein